MHPPSETDRTPLNPFNPVTTGLEHVSKPRLIGDAERYYFLFIEDDRVTISYL